MRARKSHVLPHPPARADKRALSDRECQILELLGHGLSNKEIGEKLRLSPFTVKNHLARIFARLRVHSRTGAVMAYLRRE